MSLRKCPCDHWLYLKHYHSDKHFSDFTYKMAAKINKHRYGTKLPHGHPMYQDYVSILYRFRDMVCFLSPKSPILHTQVYLAPSLGVTLFEFQDVFSSRKLEFRLRYPTFSLFNTVPASDRRTNGHDRSHFLPRLANAVDKHPVVKLYSTMSAIVFCSLAADWSMWWAVRFYCCTKCVCPLTCHCIMDEAITIRWASAEKYIIYNCCWHRVVMNI